MRRGLTVVELVAALALLAFVLALLARTALLQERLQREFAAWRGETRAATQSVTVVAGALEPITSDALYASAASDSAIEFDALVASGVACMHGATAQLAPPTDTGPALTALSATIRPGDRFLVLDERARPARWEARRVVAITSGGTPCVGTVPIPAPALVLDTEYAETPMAAFRLVRRTRFSLYHAADGAWYLGMKDWNGSTHRFNPIQPVAGPLAPYGRGSSPSGLRFAYLDRNGRAVADPEQLPATARMVRIVARGTSGRDSAYRVVSLHHAN